MLVADTDIKIADFGAASLKRTQLVTTTRMGTTRMGSPYYMSPEQLQSKPATFHSDMYSLGVMLYEHHAKPVHVALEGVRLRLMLLRRHVIGRTHPHNATA